jgi:hypothetical protein
MFGEGVSEQTTIAASKASVSEMKTNFKELATD